MTNETQVMPAVALRGITILPDMIVHFDVSRKKSIRAIEEAMTKDQRIFLITQKDPKVEEPSEDDLYKIGTVAMIKQVAKVPKDMLRVLVEGMERAELMQLEDGTSYLEAEVVCDGAGRRESSGYGKRSDASQYERTVQCILQRKSENESGAGETDTGNR